MPSPTIQQRDGGALPITTTFVPPPECTQGHLTMLAREQFFVWQNEPVPVAGATMRSCYPDRFINSYVASMAGNTLPAFSPLVCPQNYYTVSSQDVGTDVPYVVCCPTNYGFALPPATNNKRPWQGGTCYSNIISTTVTKYNEDAYSGLIFFSTAGQAYAHPFDGFAYNGQHVASIDQAPAPAPAAATATAPAQSASAAAVAAPQPSSNAASAVLRSSTGAALEQTSAAPGFTATTQISNTLVSSSTMQSVAAATSTLSSSVTPISTSGSVILYSTVPASVVIIYTPASASSSSTASQQASTHESAPLSTPAIAGVAMAIILCTLLFAAAIFFLFTRRQRRLRDGVGGVAGKPLLFNRSSGTPFGTSEKAFGFGEKPATFTTYHELGVPQEVAHELAHENPDYAMHTPVGELDAQDLDSLPVSTFSPTKK